MPWNTFWSMMAGLWGAACLVIAAFWLLDRLINRRRDSGVIIELSLNAMRA